MNPAFVMLLAMLGSDSGCEPDLDLGNARADALLLPGIAELHSLQGASSGPGGKLCVSFSRDVGGRCAWHAIAPQAALSALIPPTSECSNAVLLDLDPAPERDAPTIQTRCEAKASRAAALSAMHALINVFPTAVCEAANPARIVQTAGEWMIELPMRLPLNARGNQSVCLIVGWNVSHPDAMPSLVLTGKCSDASPAADLARNPGQLAMAAQTTTSLTGFRIENQNGRWFAVDGVTGAGSTPGYVSAWQGAVMRAFNGATTALRVDYSDTDPRVALAAVRGDPQLAALARWLLGAYVGRRAGAFGGDPDWFADGGVRRWMLAIALRNPNAERTVFRGECIDPQQELASCRGP